MNLKKATLFALISGILVLLSNVGWIFQLYDYNKLLNVLNLVGTISFVIFFYSLYKNQK